MTLQSFDNKLEQLSEAFSPSAPVTTKGSFYGRYEQLKKVESAVYEKGQHVIMYGERGVGKTSIANVIEEKFNNGLTVKLTCTRDSNFDELWKEILRTIKYEIRFGKSEADKPVERYIDEIVAEKTLDFQAVIFALSKIKSKTLIILDEFDLIETKRDISRFADAIKSFSDNLPSVTLMLVGIAENITDLIGEHASIERCISQINIPRMSENELNDILSGGLLKLKMRMDEGVQEDIINFSSGFPHYTHLLAKHSIVDALNKKYNVIVRTNFNAAIDMTIDNAYESIRFAWQKSVHSNQENSLYETVVLACALVDEDEHGTFRASDLLQPLSKISGQAIVLKSYTYHLSKLCTAPRGEVLQKVTFGKITRYRFKNPLLKAYLMLKLYKKGLLKERNKKITRF